MAVSGKGTLGIFPGLGRIGGVQVSGLAAWEAVVAHATDPTRSFPEPVFLFSYGRGQETVPEHEATVVAASRHRAVVSALAQRWPVDRVLVWHLSLLKLVPLLRAHGAAVTVFLHGIEGWRRQGWLTRRVGRRVGLFLTNSDHTWTRFLHHNRWAAGIPHRTVPLGIGAPLKSDAPPPDNPPAALMLGRLRRSEDYKGHREMIRIWPTVSSRIPGAELWIAGDGDLRVELEEMAADRGLGGRVRFWGRVDDRRKDELLARCRCFVLPSRAEGFGLAYLEAMRMGRPCLVSTRDAGREVVNPPDAGLAADPDQPADLADAVCGLLTAGSEWEARSRRARARYESRFTARHFQQRVYAALGLAGPDGPKG